MAVLGTVRQWDRAAGWGVIDSPHTPGGCWVHFTDLDVPAFRALEAGEKVCFDYQPVAQGDCTFSAVKVRRLRGIDQVFTDRGERYAVCVTRARVSPWFVLLMQGGTLSAALGTAVAQYLLGIITRRIDPRWQVRVLRQRRRGLISRWETRFVDMAADESQARERAQSILADWDERGLADAPALTKEDLRRRRQAEPTAVRSS